MQYRVYNRVDLSFIDGGYVREWSLDYDYLANNESCIKTVLQSTAMQGDIIALIETHGAYCAGVITEVDNSALEIKFKDCRELLNDSVINPFLDEITDGGVSIKHDVILTLKQLITNNFIDSVDIRQRVPIKVRTHGVCDGVWDDDGSTVEMSEVIAAAFETHNIVLDFSLDFDRAALDMVRSPHILITIQQNTSVETVIKDNIFLNEFEFSAQTIPDYNTCIVFDKSRNVKGVWYLCADNTITDNAADKMRILPRKTTSAEYDISNSDRLLPEDVAAEKLVGNIYNHCVTSKLDRGSKLLTKENMRIGDLCKIILKDGSVFDTVYSGWKDSGNNYIQLIWGKIRIDMTGRINKILRRIKHGD